MKIKAGSFDTSLRPNLPSLITNAENAHAVIGTS